MRDNLILLSQIIDIDAFVRDLFGMSSIILRTNTARATWEPDAWTVGPEFSSKWGYLFALDGANTRTTKLDTGA